MRSLALTVILLSYIPVALWHPFFGALIWTWVSIMNPHREVWGFAASLPVAMLVGVATLVGWLLSREPKRIAVNSVTVTFMALIPIVTAATALAAVPELAWEKWDLVVKTLVMSILITSMMTSKVRIHALVWVLCLSLGYFGVKGGVFTLTSGGANKVFGPAYSYITDNNHLALALIMAVPLMNYLRVHSAHAVVRFGLLAAMVLSTMSAIFTYSRGGLLGLCAMGLVLWWRSRQKALFTALFVVGIVGIFAAAPERWMERMETITSYDEDASAMSRLEIWEAALRISAGNPLLGAGFRATHSQAVLDRYAPGVGTRAVHNSHLEILVENGGIAFLLHLGLIGATWLYASRCMRLARNVPELAWARDLSAMLQASLVAYVVGGSFLSLAYYDGWWYLAIIAVTTHAQVLKHVPARTHFAGVPAVGVAPSREVAR